MRNILLFTLFHFNVLYGQSSFQEGYLVTIQNDTLFGLLKPNRFGNSPTSFAFRNSKDDKSSQNFNAQQVRFVYFDGYRYKSYGIQQILFYPNNDNDYVMDQVKYVQDSSFLEILEEGSINFYRKNVNGIAHYFIEKENERMVELDFYKYRLAKNVPEKHQVTSQIYKTIDGDWIASAYLYREQLKIALSDCKRTIDKLENIEFTEAQLRKLIQQYNQCAYNRSSYSQIRKKSSVFLGLLVGATNTVLRFNNEVQPLSLAHKYSSLRPSFGVFLLLPSSDRKKAFSLYTALSYHGFNIKNIVVKPNPDLEYNTRIESGRIRLAAGVQVPLTNWPLKPFFRAGFTGYKSLMFEANTQRTITMLGGTPSVHNYDPIPKASRRGFEAGLFGSLGLAYSKFFVELGAEGTTGIGTSSSATKIINMCLGYRF